MLSIGIAIASDSIWILVMTIPAVAITHTFVVLKEEEYLERKFVDTYRQYKSSVRRWL